METALRHFVRNVLLIHLALLLVLLVVVFLAAQEVYRSARNHALVQAERRQTLLAQETARGVQSYYDSILSDLVLMRPVNPDDPDSQYVGPALPTTRPTTRPTTQPGRGGGGITGPMLGRQLEGRLSHLFIVDKATLRVRWIGIGGSETAPSVLQIVSQIKPWLRGLKQPAMSDFQLIDGRGFHFIATPTNDRPTIIVAAVPVRRVEEWFFNELNDGSGVAATFLVNDSLQILTTGRKELVGQRISEVGSDEIRSAVASLASEGFRGTQVVASDFRIGEVGFGPSLIAAEPLNVKEHQWFVMLTSPLGDVGAIVRQMFSRALVWAVFLAVSMTAILVSTATQLIRNRARVEKLRHALLDRELAEARKIQLAWLPQGRPADTGLDVATANEPASHISGDFYNWFDLPDGRTAVAIGDVTGHGMSAAFLMASTQLLVRTTLPGVCDPGQCLQQVNHQLCVQAFNGQFVTMVLVIIDARSGRVDLASAGHPPPLLISNGSGQPLKAESDLVLGVEPGEKYRTQSFVIHPGDSLLFYTDGVIDSESPARERFGLPRLIRCAAHSTGSAGTMIDAVVAQVSAFRRSSPRADDVTLLAVRMSAIESPEPAGEAIAAAQSPIPPRLQEAFPAVALRTLQSPSRLS
jgi:serine phosphatase RsbU (regulator of sigma subunit)